MSEGGNSGNFYKSGDWNAVCDICGFRFKASKLKKNWKGEMVCEADFELRHPQEFVRVRPEKISVPWARPESEEFVNICWIWGQSAYADLGEADCMKADFTPGTFAGLYTMKWGYGPFYVNPQSTQSGIPGYAWPGVGLPGVTLTGVPF